MMSVERVVLEEAAQVLVADACAEGEVVCRTMVVCHARAIIIICGGTKHDVCALIVHWVLRIDADESANGVAPVERALGAAKDIDAVRVAQVLVHTAHACQGDIVHIHPHSRCADAAAHTTQVDAAGQAAAVGGYEESGDVGRQVLDVVDAFLLKQAGA